MNDTNELPVSVSVRRPDGTIENVRVGTAVKSGEGYVLKLELLIGAQAAAGARAMASSPARAGAASGAASAPVTGPLPTLLPNYGRSKGMPIAGASRGELEYYANGARRSLADPSKARWHDKERAMLAAIEAELARQSGGGFSGGGMSAGPGDEEPPPPDDRDLGPSPDDF